MSQDTDFAEEDIFPLEYARLNGLSLNHLSHNLVGDDLRRLRNAIVPCVDTHLPTFDFGPEAKIDERLILSKGGAALLSTIKCSDSATEIDGILSAMLMRERGIGQLRFDLPLLRSDHETDCKNFGARKGLDIKLQDVRFPLEDVNEDRLEGLRWPARYFGLGEETMKKLKIEKPQLSRDTMQWLQATGRDDWTVEDEKILWDRELTYSKNFACRHVTPPLTPVMSPLKPYNPSSHDPAFLLPMMSDPPSPTKKELDEIEKKLFAADAPTPIPQKSTKNSLDPEEHSSDTLVGGGLTPLGKLYTPLAFIDNSQAPSPEEEKLPKREELYVEGPLTPEKPTDGFPKIVRFSDVVEEMRLDTYTASPANSPGFVNQFFEDAFIPAYERANQMVEQERLVEADATARVDVPIMNFSKPDPPWKDFEQTIDPDKQLAIQKTFLDDIKNRFKLRPISMKRNDTKLKWNPFPHEMAKNALVESFDADNTAWETFVKEADGEMILTSSDMTWKPEGLMILKEDEEDDDEIEFAKFKKDAPPDMSFLIRKRKLAIEEERQRIAGASQLNHNNDSRQGLDIDNSKTKEVNPAEDHMDIDDGVFDVMLGGVFSATAAMDNFLEIRGAKKAKLMNKSSFPTKPAESQNVPQPQVLHPANYQRQPDLPIRHSPLPRPKSLPIPPPTQPHFTKSNIIVSSTLWATRPLIRSIEAQLPNVALVERDFTAHNTTSWRPGSVSRSQIRSPLDSEADIIASPSTGIILTTLQKIKQKPLPGQTGKSAIRERIESVSVRYEKLIVFVSEGRSDETTLGIDENDALAFAEFLGFTTGFNTNIVVQFTAGGSETMVKWLANTIIQHTPGEVPELLAEETHWELFLRRAGMNAFAAQAVIADLKAPEGVDFTSPSKAGLYGLTAFVEMGRDQRIERFGTICGRKLMERVSDVLDFQWR